MDRSNIGHKVIGIVCAGAHDSGTQNTILELIKTAEARGHRVLVITNFTYYNNEYSPAEKNIFKMIRSSVLNGLILMPESIKSDSLWQLVLEDAKATGLPFVCIDRDVPECTSITFDYGSAFEQVVRHIIEVHKPKRINFIGGMENNSFSEERLNVFKKVMADNGREFEPERLGYGQFWENPTLEVVEKFYNSGLEPPDAIICSNDTEAMTTCNYLRNRGIDVPNDVIVSGFDGIEEEKYMVPRLTTAACDLNGMSIKAFELLEQMMDGITPEQRLTVIPYTLRVSQSCGCKPLDEGDKINKLLELSLARKNAERHERKMFEYSAHTVELDSYDQFARMMSRFCECPTWFCFDTRVLHDDNDEEEYTEDECSEMKMFMYCSGEYGEPVYDIPFAPGELLPEPDKVLDEYHALLFAPLSYQGKLMGYLATAMDSEGFNFLFTQRHISNTNQIFETLKTKIRLQKAYAQVADMHIRDPMTGIYNRRGFYLRMADLTESDKRHFTLFSVDLDGLKYINDTFGHYAGDKAIIMTAEIVRRVAGKGAVCARFGGDEFIIVIPSAEGCISDTEYIRMVNKEIDKFNSEESEPFKLGVSIGSSCLTITDRENIDIAMKAADEKMYECKRKHHAEMKR